MLLCLPDYNGTTVVHTGKIKPERITLAVDQDEKKPLAAGEGGLMGISKQKAYNTLIIAFSLREKVFFS